MKIWVTGTRGIPGIMGGVETHCEQLLQRLATRGHEITVGCRRPYMTFTGSSYRGVTLRTFGVPRSRNLEAILHTFSCVMAAKRDHADILHIHAIGPALLTPIARILGMKVLVTHHGFDYERAKWGRFPRLMLRLGERVAMRYAHKVIAVSPHIADRLVSRYRSAAKIVYIPNGANTPAPIEASGTRTYIFALGRFVEEKGFHTLIEAYRISRLRDRDIELVIAGDSDFPSHYSRYLRKLGRDAGVSMPGYIYGNRLRQLYGNASLFVLPSTHEGLPIVLLEAMSHNIPVIASDIPANHIPELTGDAYFTPGDAVALADRLTSFFSTPRSQVSYDMSAYDWENIAEATSAIYDSLSPQTP